MRYKINLKNRAIKFAIQHIIFHMNECLKECIKYDILERNEYMEE